jgi:hypothetical protein
MVIHPMEVGVDWAVRLNKYSLFHFLRQNFMLSIDHRSANKIE